MEAWVLLRSIMSTIIYCFAEDILMTSYECLEYDFSNCFFLMTHGKKFSLFLPLLFYSVTITKIGSWIITSFDAYQDVELSLESIFEYIIWSRVIILFKYFLDQHGGNKQPLRNWSNKCNSVLYVSMTGKQFDYRYEVVSTFKI